MLCYNVPIFPAKAFVSVCVSNEAISCVMDIYVLFGIAEVHQEVPAVAEGGTGQTGGGVQVQGDCP
jgi:hypothetical protein